MPWKGASRTSPTAWLAVAATAAGLLLAGAIVVLSGRQGPQPPFITDPAAFATVRAHVERDPSAPLGLVGSGSNVPITRALLQAFPRGEGPLPLVHPSIGSGGGIRALLDGVVDIALVSRPLRERERALGLIAVPYAQVPVIVAVHADVPDRGVTAAELVAIFAGHRGTWADGSRITVLQRERGDSSHSTVELAIPGFAEANEAAYRERRWRVLYHDDGMTDALDSTPGAIGLFGQGAVPPARSIRALQVDGVAPTLQALTEHRYPFTKDLAFVTLGQPRGRAAAFIEFSRSPAAAEVIVRHGALPLSGPAGPTVQPQEDP